MTSAGRHLVVIGGGVIGLSCAFEAACAGWDVAVVDPQPGRGAGWVAAGMLAPTAEAHFGEEALTRLLVTGAGVWPKFAADLELAIGGTVGFELTGSLLAAKDAGDRSDLIRTLEFQRSLGLNVEELRPAALRSLEPNLSPTLAAGALLPNDHQVSNRLLLAGLVRACIESGVSFVHEEATALGWSGSMATVQLGSGDSMISESLLLAMGARTGLVESTLGPLPTVRPVKGHILRLRGTEPLLERTVRATVRGRNVYLVPRRDGELVVGATVEERGFDERVQAGQVFALLDDARRVLPGVDELELVESACGLRPATSTNAPVIGRLDDGPVLIATGHYRNGILLAPLTAQIIASELEGRRHPAADLVAAAEIPAR